MVDSAHNDLILKPSRIACIAAFVSCNVGAIISLQAWRYGYLNNWNYWPVWGVCVAGSIASAVMERHYRLGRDDRRRGRGFDVLPRKDEEDREP